MRTRFPALLLAVLLAVLLVLAPGALAGTASATDGPPAPSSALTTGEGRRANVLVQSICPVHVSEHLSMGTSDPVCYALVVDALTHDGPASAARISRTVCLQDVFPGIDRLTYPAQMARVVATAGQQALTHPHVAAEPALAAYAR